MAWVIFLISAYIAAFILVPANEWKRLWPAGIITCVLLYMIDSTFIRLGAFSYSLGFLITPGIPVLYLISSIAGGILLAYLFPEKKLWQLAFILISAAVFLFMELVMHWLGYFQYDQWRLLNSYFLNIIGFSAVLRLSQCFGSIGKSNDDNRVRTK